MAFWVCEKPKHRFAFTFGGRTLWLVAFHVHIIALLAFGLGCGHLGPDSDPW